MATRWAVANGNWSSTGTWNGGTLPTAGDDVHANNFTVAVDQTVNVGSLRTTAGTGITAGGTFSLTTAQTITLTGSQGVFPGSATNPVLSISHATGTVAIAGTLVPGSGANQIAANIAGAGAVNIIGAVGSAIGTGANAVVIANTATGPVSVTGPVVGSASGSGAGINSASAASVLTVTGSVTGGPSGSGISAVGAVTVVGDIAAANVAGIALAGSAMLNHTGMVTASANANGFSSNNAQVITVSTGPFISSATRMAVSVSSLKIALATTTTYWEFPTGDGGTRRLYTADNVGGNPAVGNVRQGTVYGPANELTGTLIVPNPANVASGVPTDHTVGTATLSAADVAAAVWAEGGRGAKLDSLQTSIIVVS